MKLVQLVRLTLLALGAVAAAMSASAQMPSPPTKPDGAGVPPRTERRGPPPEAMAACVDKKPNDACTFVSPLGKETGTCV